VASQAAVFASGAGVLVSAISAIANYALAKSVANGFDRYTLRWEADINATRDLNAAERIATRESREANRNALIGGGILVTIIATVNKYF
jgi:hypothetical protein